VRRLLLALVLSTSACLPGYDNMFMGQGLGDGGGTDGGLTPSGFNVTGGAINLEDLKFGPGQTVRFSTIDDPAFVSPATDSNGRFTLPIPQSLLGQLDYFVIEGSYLGNPILRTHYLPRITMDGKADNSNILVHFFRDDMTDIRSYIAQALVTHGDLASADQFASTFSFMYGSLIEDSAFGLKVFRSYSLQLSVDGDGGQMILDQSNCHPNQQCCLYYAFNYNTFINTSPLPPSLLSFGATSSPADFAVVCPAGETGELTLAQTAPLSQIVDQSTNSHPSVAFPNITAPRIAGDGVLIIWPN
jgi:hypothetical protein